MSAPTACAAEGGTRAARPGRDAGNPARRVAGVEMEVFVLAERYMRPDWFTVHVINPLVRWAGIASTLEVARRVSGTTQRVPVNVLELEGDSYLVAVRGHTHWVWNLRAVGHCAVRRHLRRVRYQATELPVAERPAVIAAYRARWGRVGPFFEELPDPADHPVFRLDPDAPVTRPASAA